MRLSEIFLLIILAMDCSPSRSRSQSPPSHPPERKRRRYLIRRRREPDYDADSYDDADYPLERPHHTPESDYDYVDSDDGYPLDRMPRRQPAHRHSRSHDDTSDEDPLTRKRKKSVHWGTVTKIVYASHERIQDTVTAPPTRRPGKSSLKPRTPQDGEMELRNLRSTIGEVSRQLDLYYNIMACYCGEGVLEQVMMADERSVFEGTCDWWEKNTPAFAKRRNRPAPRYGSGSRLALDAADGYQPAMVASRGSGDHWQARSR